ncbi:casein kinase 2 regulatory subunit [Basidiobolus ranarum]|uniref:Casein kinase II subunit beta n=1 Tax=Basidiobolus ranarum TaxID=34480 RepID=A0ABR2VW03_9FUNG
MDPADAEGSSKLLVDEQAIFSHELASESIHDSDIDSVSESVTWVAWFCSLSGNEYLIEVTDTFLEDDFNFTGLGSTVPFYREALEMILDIEPERKYSGADTSLIESSAERLYGLIHQRYILSRQGMNQMANKYERGDFGLCPRYYCNGTPMIPSGRSDSLGVEPVKLYCPNCLDLYTPPSSRFQSLDGAFFGTTFAHIFFMTFCPSIYTHFNTGTYTPRIYGFKLNERSNAGPHNRWLRMRYSLNDDSSESLSESDISSDSEGCRQIVPGFNGMRLRGEEVESLTSPAQGETTSRHDGAKSERSSMSRFSSRQPPDGSSLSLKEEKHESGAHNSSRHSTLCILS